MHKSLYKVTLKEPLVIRGKDKTEISLDCLDYIPGNIFLGIAARKLYSSKEKDKERNLDLFHNGNVQFGNAYLCVNENQKTQSRQIPATYYKNDSEFKTHDEATDKSYKQVREGYFFIEDKKIKYAKAKKNVVLKGAYDSARKSAKAQQLYLFQYLEKGQQFIFEIRSTDEKYLDDLSEIFIGNHQISKSKSSEFGAISIECIEKNESVDKLDINDTLDCYKVYAKSNLAFVNQYGAFTHSPTSENLGFTNGEIDYQKSQLYFDKLHTRNGKRRTHDADRLIIKKGSVFVIKAEKNKKIEIDENRLNKGIGVFLAEGYGQVEVNPAFLAINGITIETQEFSSSTSSEEEDGKPLKDLETILNICCEKENLIENNYKAVAGFINDENKKELYRNISPSQWGAIRGYIQQGKNNKEPNTKIWSLIFHEKEGYIYHGTMGKKWDETKRDELKKFVGLKNDDKEISDGNIEKLLLLSIEYPKSKEKV